MVRDGRRQFGQALAARRRGELSAADSNTPYERVKPDFYADSNLLIRDVTMAFGEQRVSAGDKVGVAGSWDTLETSLMMAVKRAFVAAGTFGTVRECPYHQVLGERLGGMSLPPVDRDVFGYDTLCAVSLPGGVSAPALIVNLVRRMQQMRAQHEVGVGVEQLARASSGPLLAQPLAHPQQHAKAFMFTLAEGVNGSESFLDRDTFMPEWLIEKYTCAMETVDGRAAIGWAISTEDFVLRTAVTVADRTKGSEMQPGEHQTVYPAGTRLGDIAVTEPTIGCPGSKLAYAMWERTIDVAVDAGLIRS